MKNNKVNFVIDGNLIFHTMVAIKPDGWLADGKHITDMCLAVHNMIGSALQRMPVMPIRIIFVLDSLGTKTWRKHYSHVSGVKYKGHRKKKKSKFERETMEMAMRTLLEFYNKNHIHTVCVDGAEGDDAMYLISRRLWANDESTLLLTGDSDMRQILLHEEDTHKFVGIMDSHKQFVFVTSYNPQGVEYDMYQDNNSPLSSMTENDQSYVYVEPDSFIVRKMLAGDKGDNVPPSYMYINTKDTKSKLREDDEKIISDFVMDRFGIDKFELIFGSDMCEQGKALICRTKVSCKPNDTSYTKYIDAYIKYGSIELDGDIGEVVAKYTKRNKAVHLCFAGSKCDKVMRYSPSAAIYGFSEKRAKRLDGFMIPSPNQLFEDSNVRKSTVKLMMDHMDHVGTDDEVGYNEERLYDNVRVMWLSHSTIPQEIIDAAEKRFSEILVDDEEFDHKNAMEMFSHSFFGTDESGEIYEDAFEVRSTKPRVWYNINEVELEITGKSKKVEKVDLGGVEDGEEDYLW